MGTSEKLSIRNGGGKFPASVKMMQNVAPIVLTSTRTKVHCPFWKIFHDIIELKFNQNEEIQINRLVWVELNYRMSNRDVKWLDIFDGKSTRPVRDVFRTSDGSDVAGQTNFPTSVSVMSSVATVVHQTDAQKLISIESRPVKGKTRLWIGLQMSCLGLHVLKVEHVELCGFSLCII